MGKSASGDRGDRTDLFDPNRNDVTPPSDNFSDARLARPQHTQRSGDQTYRLEGGGTIVIKDNTNVTVNIINDGGRENCRDEDRTPVRMGRGRESYAPRYDEYANSRAAYREEAYLNPQDNYDRFNPPRIPQCHRQERYSGYQEGPQRWGDTQAVASGAYDYRGYDDRRSDRYDDRRHSRNPIDSFFGAIGSIARGIGDVAYEARPILQTWAQIEMIKHGGFGGRYYGNGYDNSYYSRPYNRYNTDYNRNLIAYNNNSGYYDNSYDNGYAYNPSWLNG